MRGGEADRRKEECDYWYTKVEDIYYTINKLSRTLVISIQPKERERERSLSCYIILCMYCIGKEEGNTLANDLRVRATVEGGLAHTVA